MSANAFRPVAISRRSATAVAASVCALVCGVAAAADAPSTALQAGPVSLTFGGYTALEALYRDRAESTDIGSNFNTGIPFAYQANQHLTEFRASARQSRLSLLAQGPHSGSQSAEGYMEFDFLGAAPTANSQESNSYNLRIRNIYGVYRNADSGLYVLAGQSWSLATLYKKGLAARQEQVPQTIDAQYVPGFNWTRNPQIRVVKDFGNTAAVGISLESPQALINNSGNVSATTTLAGSGQFASTNNYSLDFAPDVIVKAAFDPGYGHYEVYGLARGFRDRANNTNNTVWGTGIGAGAILPLAKQVDFQISGLAGTGIGRYGSSQLPDVTVKPDGTLATISGVDALVGVLYRPTPVVTLYLYGGMEQASKAAYTNAAGTTGYGYGSPLYNNSGCNSLTGSAATCVANTKQSSQISLGTWWKYYQGEMGNLQFGLQGSHTKREAFAGVGGNPSTSMNVVMASFRYFPYQR
jgi:hypothetical protein